MLRRRLAQGAAGLGIAFAAAQLVPYGRAHENPPVVEEPAWPTPEVRALAVRACFDCHSHQTNWPWYSHVAPISWLVQHDVDEGQSMLNLSAWNEDQPGADDVEDELRKEGMPLKKYLLVHPEARLTTAERQQLIEALTASKP